MRAIAFITALGMVIAMPAHAKKQHHRYSHSHHEKPRITDLPRPIAGPPIEPAVDPALLAYEGEADGMAMPRPRVIRSRPKLMTGRLRIGNLDMGFASGGRGWSIPYGDYPIDDSAGEWGKHHGAVGLNGDSIYDPVLGRDREGIE